MNRLRRLPLNRLLALCALVVALGVTATALASTLGSGPVPPAKPLAQAVHDALAGTGGEVQGVSARIQLTNHLLEGANLATGGGGAGGGGQIASSPLLAGASGRLWISKEGDVRIELQTENGDTEVLYDGHTLSLYDAATNTLYRYTPPAHEGSAGSHSGWPGYDPSSTDGHATHEAPTVAKIEEALSHLSQHANVSSTPTDVAGQPAYTVRVSPKETGSLLGAAELSFDADNGAPLRAAVYSTSGSAPVIELAASEISFGAVSSSVFAFTPPASAKIEDISPQPDASSAGKPDAKTGGKPKVTTQGKGLSSVAILESKRSATGEGKSSEPLPGLPQVSIDGTNASELRTELGTLLSFERGGVRYVLAGAVAPSAIEAIARGL